MIPLKAGDERVFITVNVQCTSGKRSSCGIFLLLGQKKKKSTSIAVKSVINAGMSCTSYFLFTDIKGDVDDEKVKRKRSKENINNQQGENKLEDSSSSSAQ